MRQWYVIVGVILAVLLPILVALNIPPLLHKIPVLAGYPVAFGAVALSGQLGLVVKRIDQRHPAVSLVRDVLIAMVAGFGAYWATRLMVMRGGGFTDPTLLAVVCTYLLLVWQAPVRRR